MADFVIERPTRIDRLDAMAASALRDGAPDVLTIAAFLIVAGAWHFPHFRDPPILEDKELKVIGLSNWAANAETLDADEWPRDIDALPSGVRDTLGTQSDFETWPAPEYYGRLIELVRLAVETGQIDDTLNCLALGLAAPDAIVRACALRSAVDLIMFRPPAFFAKIAWFAERNFDQSETAGSIVSITVAKVAALQAFAAPALPQAVGPAPTAKTPLLPIHGTNFVGSRPEWSVPGVGGLYNYLKAYRRGIVGPKRYFRWEGGYSDYAREVAGDNLARWSDAHSLNRCDAVCHSHGCNVLMLATHQRATFGNVVLLSCPVHYHKYRPKPHATHNIQSVRIMFDFVIAADRGAQRFPQNTIPEHVLPLWYVSHGAPTKETVWQKHKLLKYL